MWSNTDLYKWPYKVHTLYIPIFSNDPSLCKIFKFFLAKNNLRFPLHAYTHTKKELHIIRSKMVRLTSSTCRRTDKGNRKSNDIASNMMSAGKKVR